MKDIPLTKEQQQFAEEHHNLVWRFLREHHLAVEECYDIAVFGYLKAVRKYLTEPHLQQYAFSTIAFRRMRAELYCYYKAEQCRKQKVQEISIHSRLHPDGETLEMILPARDEFMQQLEEKLVLHELAKHISRKQMDMVRQKSSGYGTLEIAQNQKTTVKAVRLLFLKVRRILLNMYKDS